jgi:hypothetical protein
MSEAKPLLPVHNLMGWRGKSLPVTDTVFIKLAGSQLYGLYRDHVNSRRPTNFSHSVIPCYDQVACQLPLSRRLISLRQYAESLRTLSMTAILLFPILKKPYQTITSVCVHSLLHHFRA